MDDKKSLDFARRIILKKKNKGYVPETNGMEAFEESIDDGEDLSDIGLSFGSVEERDSREELVDSLDDDEGTEIHQQEKGPEDRLKFLKSYLMHRTLRGK